MKRRILTLIIALVFSTSAFAARYLVQPGIEGTSQWTDEAIAVAGTEVISIGTTPLNTTSWIPSTIASGDEIWIIGGTYKTTGTLVLNKSGVIFMGGFEGTETSADQRPKSDLDGNSLVEPWEFTNLTIIDAQASENSYYRCATLAGSNTVIDGLVLQGGVHNGGTFAIDVAASCTMKNSIVRNNRGINRASGTMYAGATAVSGTVESCLIENNIIEETCTVAAYGAGITGSSAGARIVNCVIRNNQNNATGGGNQGNVRGGGVFLFNGSSIYNCVVVNNYSKGQGGGIFSNNGGENARVVSCIVANNKASLGTGGVMLNQMGTMYNTLVFGNVNTQDGSSNGNGNFTNSGTASYAYAYNCTFINGKVAGNGKYGEEQNTVLNLEGEIADYFAAPNTIVGAATNAEETATISTSNWNLISDVLVDVSNKGTLVNSTTDALINDVYVSTDINGQPRSASAPDLGAYEYNKFIITTAISPEGQGTAVGDGEFYYGQVATVEATAEENYEFVNWTLNDLELSGTTTYDYIVTDNAILTANFKPDGTVGIGEEEQIAIAYISENTLVVDAIDPVAVEVYTVRGVKIAETNFMVNHTIALEQGTYVIIIKNGKEAIRVKAIVR